MVQANAVMGAAFLCSGCERLPWEKACRVGPLELRSACNGVVAVNHGSLKE
jgi:hypothetical protein